MLWLVGCASMGEKEDSPRIDPSQLRINVSAETDKRLVAVLRRKCWDVIDATEDKVIHHPRYQLLGKASADSNSDCNEASLVDNWTRKEIFHVSGCGERIVKNFEEALRKATDKKCEIRSTLHRDMLK